MKLQILDLMNDLTYSKWGGGGGTISFFNDLDTGIRNMLENLGSIPRPLFHFLMILTEEQELCSLPLFHFLMMLPQKHELSSQLVSFFNELEIRKPCSKMVSFFNEIEIIKPCSRLVSFFNELEIRKSCSTDAS
jgi:hypothetical protein